MKKMMMMATALALTAGSQAMAQAPTAPSALLQEAQAAYAQRDFTNPGSQSAQHAADLYAQLVAQTSDAKTKAQYLIRESEALYFVGTAASDNGTKVTKHLAGENAADQATKLLGISDITKATAQQIKSNPNSAAIADATYYRSANLGEWGQANGIASSLGKWSELKNSCLLIIASGYGTIRDFGAERIVGLGLAKVPGLFGGSSQQGEAYLAQAVNGTLAAGQDYSINGNNNLFYAQVLQQNGKTSQAKTILQNFVKADANTLNPNLVPENKHAQALAQAMLRSM